MAHSTHADRRPVSRPLDPSALDPAARLAADFGSLDLFERLAAVREAFDLPFPAVPAQLLTQYPFPATRYDEMLESPTRPRQHWRVLLEAIDTGSPRSRELALELLRSHRSNLVSRAMQQRMRHPFEPVRIAALRWMSEEHTPDLEIHLRQRWGEPRISDRERVAALIPSLASLDNTIQYSWLIELSREFFGFEEDRITTSNWEELYETALEKMSSVSWADEVLAKSGIESVFLTNDFDDPLEGFDASRYIPCLRTDDLVFHWSRPETRERLAHCSEISIDSAADLREAITERRAQIFDPIRGQCRDMIEQLSQQLSRRSQVARQSHLADERSPFTVQVQT